MIKIMLDMDGVLVDFVGGAAKAHGTDNPYSYLSNHGKYEAEEAWGMTTEELFRPIKSMGYKFWSNLDPTREAGFIISLASRYDPECAILTSCTDDDCVKGKKHWIEEVFPKLRNRMIFAGSANAKRMLANSNTILIDDKDSNIDEWKAADGRGFLFPRPWNSAYRFSPETGLKELEKFLDELAGEQGSRDDERSIRTFSTGANRDTDNGKLDYEGFLSPGAIEAFAQYMHKNRVMKDGTFRDSDNWQKGIPIDVYMKSMWRHFMDVWILHRNEGCAVDIEESLCALWFNVQGYLHEIAMERYDR